jgi:hypothetical protein
MKEYSVCMGSNVDQIAKYTTMGLDTFVEAGWIAQDSC